MNSNVELLKRNLKNWLNKNNNESEDLKKKIIDTLNYFKSFLNNDLVLMLNDLSKTYDFKNNKERIEIYSNDSDSLKEQNYLVLITNEPRIIFFAKDSTNQYITFDCRSLKYYLCIKDTNRYSSGHLLEVHSDDFGEVSRTLDNRLVQRLREIYEPISEILELMKNQSLIDDMVNRCNEKIESLLN